MAKKGKCFRDGCGQPNGSHGLPPPRPQSLCKFALAGDAYSVSCGTVPVASGCPLAVDRAVLDHLIHVSPAFARRATTSALHPHRYCWSHARPPMTVAVRKMHPIDLARES